MSDPTAPACAQLFLAADRAHPDDLGATLDAWARDAAARVPSMQLTVGRRTPDPSEAALVERGYRFDHSSTDYVEMVAPDARPDDLLLALAGVAGTLAETIVWSDSYVALGRVHTILAGDGSVVGLHWLRRRADFTAEAFHDYWGGGHTSHSRTLAGELGYRQHHVDAASTADAARASGLQPADFDGVAITNSVSLDAHVKLMTGAGASRGMSDNANFVDVDRSPYLTVWNMRAPAADAPGQGVTRGT